MENTEKKAAAFAISIDSCSVKTIEKILVAY